MFVRPTTPLVWSDASPTIGRPGIGDSSVVDQQWAVEQLQTFVARIEEMSTLYQTIHTIGGDRPEAVDMEQQVSELEDELCRLEPGVQIVMDAVDPDLRNYQRFDPDLSALLGGLSWTERCFPRGGRR